ncbi:MAG: archaeal proteasome endopeptidase complex subunit alpha [Thermoplasmata archaeon]
MHGNVDYDRTATVFSPDGRLFQVEYAREAVKRGTTAVTLIYKDGIVLLADKRVNSKLVEAQFIEKLFKINDKIGCVTSGLVADARRLVEYARVMALRYEIVHGEKISIGALVKEICDLKQSYTQSDGVRPFGASLLIGGIDDMGIHLYETDVSGTPIGYKAGCIGANKDEAMKFFEAQYKEELNLNDAMSLGLNVLSLNSETPISSTVIDVGVVTKTEIFKKLSPEEIQKYIDVFTQRKQDAQKEKIEKEKQTGKKK